MLWQSVRDSCEDPRHKVKKPVFQQFYGGRVDTQTLCTFNTYHLMVWTHTKTRETITTVMAIDTSISKRFPGLLRLLDFVLFYVVRARDMRSTCLTDVSCTVLCLTCRCCVVQLVCTLHLPSETLYLVNNYSLLPLPPAPGNHNSALCFYESDYFRLLMEVGSSSVCLSMTGVFQHSVLQIHPCCHKRHSRVTVPYLLRLNNTLFYI